jgi:hypothetical protein
MTESGAEVGERIVEKRRCGRGDAPGAGAG